MSPAESAEGDVPPYTVVALRSVEDMARRYGVTTGSARFASASLQTQATGMSLQSLKPGARQEFGHRHERAEEIYVVIAGSGRVKLEEEIVPLAQWDALRVAAPVARAFEAGPEGLEMLVFGERLGDAETLPEWWKD